MTTGDYSLPAALLRTVVRDTTKLKTIIPNKIRDAIVVAIIKLPPDYKLDNATIITPYTMGLGDNEQRQIIKSPLII